MYYVLFALWFESSLTNFAYTGSSLQVENSGITWGYFGYKANLKCTIFKWVGDLVFGMYLSVDWPCGTWEHLACQIHGEVPTGCVLVQLLINSITLTGVAVERQHIYYSQAALWNACDAVSELVCRMPVSLEFSVPGSRGILVSCFNPILFYWIIYYLQVMGKVGLCF